MSWNGPATLEQLRLQVQAELRRIGRGFRNPADDWPVLQIWVQTPEQGVERVQPGFPTQFGWQKDVLMRTLKEASRLYGVIRFVLVVNTHMVTFDSEKEEARANEIMARVRAEEMRLEDLPESVECLTMLVGDAEEEHLWRALIRRDERRPPTLSPWEQVDADPETTMDGRFTGFSEAIRGLHRREEG